MSRFVVDRLSLQIFRSGYIMSDQINGGENKDLEAIHQSAFVSFPPNGPMGASYLIIWANGSFSFSQNETNAD